MSQLFSPTADTVVRACLGGIALLTIVVGLGAWRVENAPFATEADLVVDQPIPFSHEHHVGGLGIDCRYCHADVARSSYAGMPTTEVCMSCHSRIWTNADLLKPVRESWLNNTPIVWSRVHNLPRYVYFNHGIHVAKGVGCATCHGRVDQMPLMYQASTLQMGWCLDCHRHPKNYLRPRDEVLNMNYVPPPDQQKAGAELVQRYHVRSPQELQNCSVCHR